MLCDKFFWVEFLLGLLISLCIKFAMKVDWPNWQFLSYFNPGSIPSILTTWRGIKKTRWIQWFCIYYLLSKIERPLIEYFFRWVIWNDGHLFNLITIPVLLPRAIFLAPQIISSLRKNPRFEHYFPKSINFASVLSKHLENKFDNLKKLDEVIFRSTEISIIFGDVSYCLLYSASTISEKV